MVIAISGASGYIGRHTTQALLNAGTPASDLILVTRRPETLKAAAELGAKVRQGDFSRPKELAQAFAGADRLFLIAAAPDNLPDGVDQVAAHTAAITAAAKAGVRHVFFQSSLAAAEDAHPRDEDDYATEQTLKASGLHWTMLRTGAFADSRGREAKAQLQAGEIVTNMGQGRYPTTARADIAAAAARLLASDGHAGKVYNLVAPGVTMDAVGRALSDIAGRPIAVRHLSDADYRQALIDAGRRPGGADRQVEAGRAIREMEGDPFSDLPALIGRPGLSLIDLIRANPEELLTGEAPAGREPVFDGRTVMRDLDDRPLAERYADGAKIRSELTNGRAPLAPWDQISDFSRPFRQMMGANLFNDIWRRPGLTRRERCLIVIGGLAGMNRIPELKNYIGLALDSGVTRDELQEVLLMMAVYCGTAAGTAAFQAAEEVFAQRDKA